MQFIIQSIQDLYQYRELTLSLTPPNFKSDSVIKNYFVRIAFDYQMYLFDHCRLDPRTLFTNFIIHPIENNLCITIYYRDFTKFNFENILDYSPANSEVSGGMGSYIRDIQNRNLTIHLKYRPLTNSYSAISILTDFRDFHGLIGQQFIHMNHWVGNKDLYRAMDLVEEAFKEYPYCNYLVGLLEETVINLMMHNLRRQDLNVLAQIDPNGIYKFQKILSGSTPSK